MVEITRESVMKGEGQMTAHMNFGGGKYGYANQHVQFPRLGWIDCHGRWPDGLPPRKWLVDGVDVGTGTEGLDAAIEALGRPVEITETERSALAVITEDFQDARAVENLVGEALVEAKVIDREQARVFTFTVMHFLKAKGLIEYGREELPPGTAPIEHLNYRPTVRRRAA